MEKDLQRWELHLVRRLWNASACWCSSIFHGSWLYSFLIEVCGATVLSDLCATTGFSRFCWSGGSQLEIGAFHAPCFPVGRTHSSRCDPAILIHHFIVLHQSYPKTTALDYCCWSFIWDREPSHHNRLLSHYWICLTGGLHSRAWNARRQGLDQIPAGAGPVCSPRRAPGCMQTANSLSFQGKFTSTVRHWTIISSLAGDSWRITRPLQALPDR